MKPITLNPIALWAAILTGSLVIGLGIQFVAAWNAAPPNPPSGNVAGPLTTSNTTQDKLGNLTVNSNGTYQTGFNVAKGNLIVPNGNVGIGTISPATKLDVNGPVKIGNTAAACSASLAGAVRYNANQMEYCDGSSSTWAWKAMGGGGCPRPIFKDKPWIVDSIICTSSYTHGGLVQLHYQWLYNGTQAQYQDLQNGGPTRLYFNAATGAWITSDGDHDETIGLDCKNQNLKDIIKNTYNQCP